MRNNGSGAITASTKINRNVSIDGLDLHCEQETVCFGSKCDL